MNRETIKTFILAVLVALSFLLSYILWSYQPKYEMFYDASYISEVDIGGKERSKSELIRPSEVVFHKDNVNLLGFIRSSDEYIFYKDMTTWSLTDFSFEEINKDQQSEPEGTFIEVVFPSEIAASLIRTMFSINEEVEFPTWSFDRFYIEVQDDAQLNVQINAMNGREQLQAKIEKAGAYQMINRYNAEHPHLQPYVEVPFGEKPIYIPLSVDNVTKKTLVANPIDPELFIDALFSNPSLVRPNQEESFFSDGQRGMRIFQNGRYLEFIHPIETNDEKLEAYTLIDKSINHVNEHKGWTNEYHLDSLHLGTGEIQYRLHYDGVPVFDFNNLSIIEQTWREQELYQYRRSLINIGHLLSSSDVTLPTSYEVIQTIEQNEDYKLDQITDIRPGYYLHYNDEVHSLTLEPTWFMRYEGNWLRVPFANKDE